MSDTENNVGDSILAVLFGGFHVWFEPFVALKLWGWFVVPNFGLPALSWSQMFGLDMLLTVLIVSTNHNTYREDATPAIRAFSGVVKCAFALGAGYLAFRLGQ
jgi:hypothetical protein